jgi:DNA-binding MarR family transcriptional regulator
MRRRLAPSDAEILALFTWVLGEFIHEWGTITSPPAGLVLCAIYLEPGRPQHEIAATLSLSRFAVSRACRSLERAGALTAESRGREKHYTLSPRAATFFDRLMRDWRQRIVTYRIRAIRKSHP